MSESYQVPAERVRVMILDEPGGVIHGLRSHFERIGAAVDVVELASVCVRRAKCFRPHILIINIRLATDYSNDESFFANKLRQRKVESLSVVICISTGYKKATETNWGPFKRINVGLARLTEKAGTVLNGLLLTR